MLAGLRVGALLGLGLLSAGCISGSYLHNRENLPLLERAQAELASSAVSLARCLEVMGAPTLVYEHNVHGLLLVYAWNDVHQWNASLSIPAGDSTNASFSFANIRQNQQGVVLWLDADWQLVEWKQGYLRSLIGSEPAPATLEQLASS